MFSEVLLFGYCENALLTRAFGLYMCVHSYVDIDAKTLKGPTSLYIAAQSGHKDVVELLLANGAGVREFFSAPLYMHW